jgi:HlyD family secretion protein
MKHVTNRKLIASLATVTVIAALLYALRPKPIGVDILAATEGPMEVLVEEEGRTRVKQVYAVSVPITGRVLRPTLDVGDTVVKDHTVVAVIRPTHHSWT